MLENGVRVWCLLGRKAGDNTQVRALAAALGWSAEEKRIQARPWELLVHLGAGPTLAGIDRRASSPLEPPWPDLILTAGRRNEPVAHWIKRQSGGRSRLVHIGRPWADLPDWDLIITTPQYFLPETANIVHNSLPLHGFDPTELAEAGRRLQPRLGGLPRPWIALLVGGNSGRFVFTRRKGRRLGKLADRLAAESGGSLLVSDSPRTPRRAADALEAQLTVPRISHRWGSGGDNPYRGMLALADAFIVTGESMSMLGEAAASGRPLFIFDPGDGATPWFLLPHAWSYRPLSHRLAMALGPRRMRRDVGRIQEALVAGGTAQWLREESLQGEAARLRASLQQNRTAGADSAVGRLARDELSRAAQAVRRLFPAQ